MELLLITLKSESSLNAPQWELVESKLACACNGEQGRGRGIKNDLSVQLRSYCQGIGLVKMFVWVFQTQTSFFDQSNILVNLKKKKKKTTHTHII